MSAGKSGGAAAAGIAACVVRRWEHGIPQRPEPDRVAVEEPLEIRIETRSIAVVMRTPGHDEELAAGFVLSEGILRDRASLRAVKRHPRNKLGNVVDVFLAEGMNLNLDRFTRHVFASSSCGLCGVATIDAVRRQFPKVSDRTPVSVSVIQSLGSRLRSVQEGFAATGGLHAAALFAADGNLLVLREDIGRHNAVDKVVGRMFLDERLPVPGAVLWVSGRVSFEILQKALAAQIPVVVAVGAPSSLAIELAQANGQTLVGFLRDGRFNVYAGPRRLRAS